MLRLIESGRLIEWIIGAMLIEAAALWLWQRRRGSGLAPQAVVTILASGICLMLALRASRMWPTCGCAGGDRAAVGPAPAGGRPVLRRNNAGAARIDGLRSARGPRGAR